MRVCVKVSGSGLMKKLKNGSGLTETLLLERGVKDKNLLRCRFSVVLFFGGHTSKTKNWVFGIDAVRWTWGFLYLYPSYFKKLLFKCLFWPYGFPKEKGESSGCGIVWWVCFCLAGVASKIWMAEILSYEFSTACKLNVFWLSAKIKNIYYIAAYKN